MKISMSAFSLAAALLMCAVAAAQDFETPEGAPIRIEEWRIPYEASRPRDPFAVGPDAAWFVGQSAGYMARLDAVSGAIEKIDLPEGEGAHNLIVGSDGVVWYAGNRRGVIGRYDPSTEEIAEIPMPVPAARDPHTLIFDAAEENIWFTVQGGNFMGRLNVASRKVDLIPSKTERSRPYGIKLAPDGSIWVVLFGTSKLAHINPETLMLEEVDLPRATARPRRLEIGDDGRVWYVDYAGGRLGVFDPATKEFTEFMTPSGEGARPYGTVMDGAGRPCFVETGVQPNLFTCFDPQAEEYVAAAVPSGGGTVRHLHFDPATGAAWFGADTNTIGRAFLTPARAQ